jgi:hypothetical protein
MVVGFGNGVIERSGLLFEHAAASKPLRMLRGPSGTVIIGFGDGVVGMWDDERGQLLARAKLHGPVQHMLRAGSSLYVASALGHQLVWQLDSFETDYCRLMRLVWSRVPVVWENGRAQSAPPPPHRCAH